MKMTGLLFSIKQAEMIRAIVFGTNVRFPWQVLMKKISTQFDIELNIFFLTVSKVPTARVPK